MIFPIPILKSIIFFFECKKKVKEEIRTYWFNREGTLLHEGNAYALSEKFLCISDGLKYGIIYNDGKTIIDFLYDEIVLNNDMFIVRNGNKLGICDFTGTTILDVSYCSIESVVITNDYIKLGKPHSFKKNETCKYPGYCKEYCLDTNDAYTISNYIHDFCGTRIDSLYREAVFATEEWRVYYENQKYNPKYFIERRQEIKDFTKPLIISTGFSKMIFIKSEGILPNSEYDDILQITPICYVVKKDNLYGVYRVDIKDLVIPIEYDSIKFYGGHTVLVCKDNLWGARSLVLDTSVFKIFLKVSIPNEYLEIKILDDYQFLFGCKNKSSYPSDEHYTIVRSNGEEIKEISELECNSQFVCIDSDHFITSIEGKYGFINSKGRKVIPFKYDEIIEREDSRFDVRINNRWGILTIEGYEVVPVKYSSPLPAQFVDNDKAIVRDAESKCEGLIGANGIEMIPTVYECLMGSKDDDLFYFGCDCIEDEEHPIFFSGDISGALWGVVKSNGKIIIDAKYANYKIQSDFIVAGRDGRYFPDDDNDDYCWYGSNYSGVYDLYNKNGELLIGGFREFEYDERNEIFIFFFGGDWKEYSVLDDDWNNIHIKGYKFDRGDGLWLFLDKDFKTILRDKVGNSKSFEKSFIGKITSKKERDQIRYISNMPIEFMAKGFSHVAKNSIIINDSNSIYHKSQAVNIQTGRKTKFYSKIEQITETLFFFAEDKKVGIANIRKELIKDCVFITYPINDFYFIAKEIDESNSYLELRCLKDKNIQIMAISKIRTSKLISHTEIGCLKMEFDKNKTDLESIIMPRHDIFDESFIRKISLKESGYFCSKDIYWFSNDYRMEEERKFI